MQIEIRLIIDFAILSNGICRFMFVIASLNVVAVIVVVSATFLHTKFHSLLLLLL